MQAKKDAFVAREWLAADADARALDDASLAHGVGCDDAGCAVRLSDGRYVTLNLRSDGFADDCDKAAVIVTLRQPPVDCRAAVFDRERLQSRGSVALYDRAGALVVEAVRPEGLDRLWARHGNKAATDAVTAEPARERLSGSSRTQRPVDATPAPDALAPDDQ